MKKSCWRNPYRQRKGGRRSPYNKERGKGIHLALTSKRPQCYATHTQGLVWPQMCSSMKHTWQNLGFYQKIDQAKYFINWTSPTWIWAMKNKAHFLKDRPSKIFIDKNLCPNLIKNHINFSIFHIQVKANFLFFWCLYGLVFYVETIGIRYIMIWWLAFEKKPFQFWREIWIQVVVILLHLYEQK